MRDWKLGEECTHGRLGRKCDVCARDDEIAELRVRLAKYEGAEQTMTIPLRGLPGNAECDALWETVPSSRDLPEQDWDKYDMPMPIDPERLMLLMTRLVAKQAEQSGNLLWLVEQITPDGEPLQRLTAANWYQQWSAPCTLHDHGQPATCVMCARAKAMEIVLAALEPPPWTR